MKAFMKLEEFCHQSHQKSFSIKSGAFSVNGGMTTFRMMPYPISFLILIALYYDFQMIYYLYLYFFKKVVQNTMVKSLWVTQQTWGAFNDYVNMQGWAGDSQLFTL